MDSWFDGRVGRIPGAISARIAVLLLISLVALWPAASAEADESTIRVESSSVTSDFPSGIIFRLRAVGEHDIESVAVRFRVGQQTTGAYDYLDFETAPAIDGLLFYRTNTASRYIPPGTIITYSFEIEDSEGNRLDTETREFIYEDARFDWDEVSEGSVSVAYHGPVKSRAELILNAIIETIDHMGPLLGADTESPIRVTMYNNVKEMLEALPPGSSTIRRELVTEGQAYTDIGTLLVLGGGRLSEGTASHEVTHILTHRAGDSVLRSVPAWLDEGLAEYGNIVPGFSYDVALEFAISNDRLLPITSMTTRPGDPEEVIIFYGQGRSIVRYMIRRYGADSMKKLMATLKEGKSMDSALMEVYGVDRLKLENDWRAAIGAPPYVPPSSRSVRPTAVPRPTLSPYTLQSQPLSGGTSLTATPAPSTPQPAPTATTVLTTSDDRENPAEEQPGGGGSCGRPASGSVSAMDFSLLGLLGGALILGAFRRIRS